MNNTTSNSNVELLFSYGTLQLPSVQISNFVRLLQCRSDAMLGWRKDMIEITAPVALTQSGGKFHPIVRQSIDSNDKVEGTLFFVTPDDLLKADSYDVSDYHRVSMNMPSGYKA